MVTIVDDTSLMNAVGRCYDASDEIIVSSSLAKRAVLDGIGRIKKIAMTTLQVALKDGAARQLFKFSRTWTCPRTTLNLAAGRHALLNVVFYVTDADLTSDDLVIGFPVPQHHVAELVSQ